MTARGIDFTGIAYLVGLALAGYAVYRVVQSVPNVKQAIGEAVDGAQRAAARVVDAVNPTSSGNVFNQGFEGIVKAVTGRDVADIIGPKSNDGDQLLSRFSVLDAEDAELGAAIRRLALRGDDLSLNALDAEDAELGQNMAAASGAAFIDYSRLRRGVFH